MTSIVFLFPFFIVGLGVTSEDCIITRVAVMEDIIGTVLFVVDNDDVDEDEEDEEIITPSLPAA